MAAPAQKLTVTTTTSYSSTTPTTTTTNSYDDRCRDDDGLPPTCGLCRGSLRCPRVLPCLHLFCLQCLQQCTPTPSSPASNGPQAEATGQRMRCPTCGATCPVPAEGLEALTLAHHVNAGLLTLGEAGPAGGSDATDNGACGMCGEDRKQLKSYCLDCALSMCPACHKLHSRVRGSSEHNLLPLQDGGDDVSGDVKSSLREVLRKELKSKHFDRASRRRRESLDDTIGLLQEYRKSTQAGVQEALRYLCKLREEFDLAEGHIEAHAQRLVDEITYDKEKVLRQLAVRRQREEDDVMQHVRGLEEAERHVTNASHYAQIILTSASDAEVFQISRLLLTKYRDIQRHRETLMNARKIEVKARNLNPDKSSAPAFASGPGSSFSPSTSVRRVAFAATGPGDRSRGARLLPEIDFGVSVGEVYPDLLVPAAVTRTVYTATSMTGLASTANDRFVVVSFCTRKVCVYARTGQVTWELLDSLVQPITAIVTSSQRVYVTDLGDGRTGMAIRGFTLSGTPLPDHVTLPVKPWGVALTKSGDFVVCHPENRKVGIYRPDGSLKQTLRSDSGKSLFTNPRCVAVNRDGSIIISDFARNKIHIFDSEGERLLASYGSEGEGPQQFRHPCGVCCDRHGHIFVADSDNHRVHVLTAAGELRGYLFGRDGSSNTSGSSSGGGGTGGSAGSGSGSGSGVTEPVTVEVTASGELLVGEWEGKVHVVRYLA